MYGHTSYREDYPWGNRLNIVIPMLKAKDLDETIRFYVDLGGFSVGPRFPGGEGNATWCALKLTQKSPCGL